MNNKCTLTDTAISDLLDALAQDGVHKFVINQQWAVIDGKLLFEPDVNIHVNKVEYADMGSIKISYFDTANNVLSLETDQGCVMKFKVGYENGDDKDND